MLSTDVNLAAADILRLLDARGGILRFGELAGTPCSREVALMAVGWLLNEGRIMVGPAIGDWVVKARAVCGQAGNPAPVRA